MSSLSSAAEQRKLFAMHFVLRSSQWTARGGRGRREQTGGRGGSRKWRGRIKESGAMIMTTDGNEVLLRT